MAQACATLAASGVMSPSGHGNFSARLDGERMLLTGAGMSVTPAPDDLAVVRLDGSVEEGRLIPSVTEIVGMHAAVYRGRPDAGAVVHTHSPAVTAFALAHAPLPVRYEALLRHGQAEPVPVVAWAPRGSPALAAGISEALDASPGTSAVLLGNHGLLAFGPNPARAATLVIALEEAARAELAAARLGGARDFPPGAVDDVQATMA
ncbi:MAG: class II aldolase/adducin family protein [Actinomycetota bacterium]|nr:class II aldolase/adducin family protein [Actinomycetota bacterium]